MCKSCTIQVDDSQSDKFSNKMISLLNSSALTLMISLGHRTGLFDAMAELEPLTSADIAKAANLNERYVREWLSAMVTGEIVTFDPSANSYYLPPEHATWLTRKSQNNIATTTQWIPVLAFVEDRLVDCFKKGGGVSYEEYNRFHEVMADESEQTVVEPLFEKILPLIIDGKQNLENGINVLDVGCGSGRALVRLAKEYPKSNFTGYDFSKEAIEQALAKVKAEKLSNITFCQKDAANFNDTNKFELIFTFDAIHDQAQPDRVLKNIFNSLKDNGTYFMQDIAGSSYVQNNMDHPLGTFMYAISCMHCMSVSLSQDGAGLGAMWGKEKASEMLKEAGFKNVEIKELEHDLINYYYIIQK